MKKVQKISFEEFAELVKKDFRKDYEGRRSLEEINDYLENDSDATDAIEGGYEGYKSGMFSKGLTDEEFLEACVSEASYNASMCF